MEFTDEQQEYINKLVGDARAEGRKKGAEKVRAEMEDKLDALQSSVAQSEDLADKLSAVEEKLGLHREALDTFLKARLSKLSDPVKKAVEALPLDTLGKLNWLAEHEEVFVSEKSPGTPRDPGPQVRSPKDVPTIRSIRREQEGKRRLSL